MKRQRPNQILTEIIRRFKELRKSKGLSHEALAVKAAITRPAVSHIESGRRKPSLHMALKLAEAMDMELSDILKEIEDLIPKT